MNPIKVMVVGCGMRGSESYGSVMEKQPEKFEVVAVVEPVRAKREDMQRRFNLPDEMCFSDWRQAAELPKLTDCILLATQDAMHYEPALCFMEKKYDILLEKPMAPDPGECLEMLRAAKKNGVKVLVCHVLRYSPFYTTMKRILLEGVLGEVMVINHNECVGNLHQAHSFVRGNWRNKAESAPMILAKSCHDADLIQWLVDSPCTKVQSFGSLSFFKEENAPKGAPFRCTEACPHGDDCFYNAVPFYFDLENPWRATVARKPNPSNEEILEALKTGPYGRCVFRCDNDVVDHQTLNMEFENGVTAVFTMSAFNKGGRYTKIMGTKGELTADMEKDSIEVYTFADKKTRQIPVEDFYADTTISGGHGGGDDGIMQAFYEYVTDNYQGFSISDLDTSVMNHLVCFAAEASRLAGGKTVELSAYAAGFLEKE